jgi:hypothetical protein
MQGMMIVRQAGHRHKAIEQRQFSTFEARIFTARSTAATRLRMRFASSRKHRRVIALAANASAHSRLADPIGSNHSTEREER